MNSDDSAARTSGGEGNVEAVPVDNPEWECFYCAFTGDSKRSLRRHMTTHILSSQDMNSNNESPIKSSNSEINSPAEKLFAFPPLAPPKKMTHHCTVCGYLAVSAGKLKVHLRSHTGEKPFKCSFCEYACSHKSGLNAHTRKYHTRENLHSCPHCPYKALRPGHLERHIRKHTGEKPFQCTMCEASFTCMDYLNDHVRDYHYRERLFQCPHCNKKLSRPGYFEAHLRTHAKPDEILIGSGDEIPQRSLSSLITSFTSNLESTELLEAKEDSPSQRLSENENLAVSNSKSSNDVKPFSCVLCNFKCSSSGDIKSHIVSIHKNSKPYKCHMCPFECKLPAQLKSHIAIHTGDKPFKCPHCNARFTLQSRLNQHVVVHDEGRRLKCSDCDYVCYRNADMRKHMPKHTRAKAFGCPICLKSYTAASSVRQHAKNVHQLYIAPNCKTSMAIETHSPSVIEQQSE